MSIRTKRAGGKMRKIALALVAFVVGLEVVLQIAALVMSVATERRDVVGGLQDHVLCIGDSYTYGVGASSREAAYPAALANKLEDLGHPIQVINGGWPGRTSRDLVDQFTNRITHQTKVLCILIGTNDTWRQPERLGDEQFETLLASNQVFTNGFTWQWRTGKLLAILFGFEKGSWHQLGTPAPADGDPGSGQDAEQSEPAQPDGGNAIVAATAVAQADAEAKRQEEAYEILRAEGFKPRSGVRAPPNEVDRATISTFWPTLRSEGAEAAIQLLQEALVQRPESPTLLRSIINAKVGANQPITEQLEKLKSLHATAPSALTLECLMQVLRRTGNNDDASLLAEARIAQEPKAVEAWICKQDLAFRLGDWDAFRPAAVTAIELIGEHSSRQLSWILLNYVRSITEINPTRAARLVTAAWLMNPEVDQALLYLSLVRKSLPRDSLDQAIASVRLLEDASLGTFADLVAETYSGNEDGAWQEVLVDHIEMLAEVAEGRGTKVLILSYPYRRDSIRAPQLAATEATGAQWVELTEAFAEVVKTRPRSELFVPDGHCSDAGYAMIADIVAAAVVEALAH